MIGILRFIEPRSGGQLRRGQCPSGSRIRMLRESRGTEPEIRVADEPFQDLIEYMSHSDNVASIVVNETTERVDIATQVAMPQQHGLGAIQVFDTAADLDPEFPLDRLLPAGQPDTPGEEAKVTVGLWQRKPRERFREEGEVKQSPVEGDQRRSGSK